MILLQAPYPSFETSTVLPSPEWNDSTSLVNQMGLKRSMNNVVYTTVRTSNRQLFKWVFNLTSEKVRELQDFYKLYSSQPIYATDHKGRKIVGFIKNNPITASGTHRAVYSPGPTNFSNDSESLEIEFEGEVQ